MRAPSHQPACPRGNQARALPPPATPPPPAPFLPAHASHFLRPLGSSMPGLAAARGRCRAGGGVKGWGAVPTCQAANPHRGPALAVGAPTQRRACAQGDGRRPGLGLTCVVVAELGLLEQAVHLEHLVPRDALHRADLLGGRVEAGLQGGGRSPHKGGGAAASPRRHHGGCFWARPR